MRLGHSFILILVSLSQLDAFVKPLDGRRRLPPVGVVTGDGASASTLQVGSPPGKFFVFSFLYTHPPALCLYYYYGQDAELVTLPEPLSPLERATRAVSFWSRVVPILFNYANIGRKVDRLKASGTPMDPFEEQKMWDEAHEWGSTQLSSTIMDLKGFYVKSGQVLSTRVDIFPEAYTSKLQKLQDSVDPIPSSIVKGLFFYRGERRGGGHYDIMVDFFLPPFPCLSMAAVIREDLLEGEPLNRLFKEFDDKPLGSASIAQVHK